MAAQDYAGLVQQLYVTYFGRPADYFGLQSFEAQLAALKAPTTLAQLNAVVQADTAGTSALSKLVNSFSVSTESTNLYGNDNTQVGVSKFVEAIYLNLLGRAPDVDGWAFWTNAITSGNLTRANAAMAIATGALGNTTTQGLLDAATVTNKITVAGNFTTALDTVAEINGYSGDAAAASARGLLAGVTSGTDTAAYQSTVTSTIATITAGPNVNAVLTNGPDTLVGTNANDSYTATMTTGTAAAADTLNSLDSIDGGAGTNALNLLVLDDGSHTSLTALPSGVTLKNIQNLSIRSAVDINATAALATVSNVSVTQAKSVTELTVGSSTSVSVAGVTAGGDIVVDGGTSQTITATGSTVTLGATTAATGAIIVNASSEAAKVISVDGGSTVSIAATGTKVAAAGDASVVVGATTAATGAVAVAVTGAAAGGAAAVNLGKITVNGGSTVAVVQTATSDATAAAKDATAAADTITQGNIVIAGTKTTTVSVQQTAAATGVNYVAAAAGAKTVDVLTFAAMAAGDTITVDGLTFTAAKALTAAQAASAFANLAAAAVDQGNAAASLGVYSGAASGNFTSGVVGGTTAAPTLTFTSGAADGTATIVTAATGTTTAPAVSETTAGVAANDETTGKLGVIAGTVAITSTDNKIATVNLDGYGAATIASNGLTALSLANSDANVTVTNTVATTLGLTLNKVGSAAAPTVALGATYTNLNVTTAKADSAAVVTAAGVTALTVAGSNALDLTGSTLTALKTVVVSGAAGLTVDASGANVTSVDTSATTGKNTIKIDGTKATYTGGAGSDIVTLSTTAPTKAISLGAGDDALHLAAGTTSTTGALNGGDGTDTLYFAVAADAATATGNATMEAKVTGFEKLGIDNFSDAADKTVDLHNMNDINYAVVSGGSAAHVLTFSDMGANGTLEIDGAMNAGGTVAVTLADATGTSDVLNVILKASDKTADTNFGTVKATGVETVNLSLIDTNTKVSAHSHIVTVLDAAAKSIVLTGNANTTLTDGGNVALTSLDASAMTGSLTASTNGTVAETIKGGSAADTLTSTGHGDTLIGGAGDDILIVNGDLTTLTGGTGADTFNVSHATSNVNSYANITDLAAGDNIVFNAATSFGASKVVLADTAVFQDYANAAIAATGAHNALAWFQIGGNTYIIENQSGAAHSTFTNGTDVIVKITGAVDLSGASLSATTHDLVIH